MIRTTAKAAPMLAIVAAMTAVAVAITPHMPF